MDNILKSGYVIIVSDKNEKELYDALKTKYADDNWIDVIVGSESYDLDESKIYILVGDSVVIDEKIKRPGVIAIDLSDSIIMDMIDSSEDLSNARNQLIDGIILHKDTLVGIDYMDIYSVLQDCKNISVGIIHSKIAFNASVLIENLIAKAKVDISKCESAYLYVNGDIGLMEVNELANALEAVMIDEANIAFTASYDSSKVDEFYVMVLFGS